MHGVELNAELSQARTRRVTSQYITQLHGLSIVSRVTACLQCTPEVYCLVGFVVACYVARKATAAQIHCVCHLFDQASRRPLLAELPTCKSCLQTYGSIDKFLPIGKEAILAWSKLGVNKAFMKMGIETRVFVRGFQECGRLNHVLPAHSQETGVRDRPEGHECNPCKDTIRHSVYTVTQCDSHMRS